MGDDQTKFRRFRVLFDDEPMYVTHFSAAWTIAPVLEEARRIAEARLGTLPMTLHLSPATYAEAETYLNNGPWTPTEDAVRVWHPRPPPRPELFWRGVPIRRDESAPWIDVRAEEP
jgi:hypothetical protein